MLLTDLAEVLVDAESLHDAVPGDLHHPQHQHEELTSPHLVCYLISGPVVIIWRLSQLWCLIIPDPGACQELFTADSSALSLSPDSEAEDGWAAEWAASVSLEMAGTMGSGQQRGWCHEITRTLRPSQRHNPLALNIGAMSRD